VDLYEAKILIAGAGPAGAAAAAHLAAAGLGYVAVADGRRDDGFNRAEILAARLAMLAPDLHADPYPVAVDDQNSVAVASGHDLLLDATGDEAVGRLLARAGTELRVPVVHVACRGEGAAVLATRPGQTACIGCAQESFDGALFEAAVRPETAALLAGMAGAVAASEVDRVLREDQGSGAMLRTLRPPAEIHAAAVEHNVSCAVCAAVPEGAR
jgi:molybdopterin/thiamine biosynthesis adenylyltransferase